MLRIGGYQRQPVVSVAGRSFSANPATLTDLTTPTMLAAGGGPKSQSLAVTADLAPGATYSIKVFCSACASILGMTVGYIPAAQAFIPYAGSSLRALDSRSGTPFSVGEERVVDLSTRLIPTARAAVINLTATGTVAAGFLSAFSDGVAFPGNSTLNYIAAGQTVANAAVVTMKAGKIKVRCSDGATHVIVDVIGSLL